MPAQDIIELAQTEWEVPIVFTLLKDRALGFWADYHKLNVIPRETATPYFVRTNVLIP